MRRSTHILAKNTCDIGHSLCENQYSQQWCSFCCVLPERCVISGRQRRHKSRTHFHDCIVSACRIFALNPHRNAHFSPEFALKSDGMVVVGAIKRHFLQEDRFQQVLVRRILTCSLCLVIKHAIEAGQIH
jgi:hypothetical protein